MADYAANTIPGLTARQSEVARLLARGLTLRQIGRELGIRAGTCRNHTAHIYATLGVQCRAQLIVLMLNRGWVDLAEIGPDVDAAAVQVAANCRGIS